MLMVFPPKSFEFDQFGSNRGSTEKKPRTLDRDLNSESKAY